MVTEQLSGSRICRPWPHVALMAKDLTVKPWVTTTIWSSGYFWLISYTNSAVHISTWAKLSAFEAAGT